MLSEKQKTWYWGEWSRVVKCCRDYGRKLTNDDRYALTVRALGVKVSMLNLDNHQFDKVIGVFKAINTPDDLNPQLRQINQPRTRMLHKIINDLPPRLAVVLQPPPSSLDPRLSPSDAAMARVAAAESYILSIMRQKYKTETPKDLSDHQLHLLIIDISNRINQRRHGLDLTCAEIETRAETLLFKLTHAHAA